MKLLLTLCLDVPLNLLVANPSKYLTEAGTDIYVVCRLGNDSQIAVEALRSVSDENAVIKDVVGGLKSWSRDVDVTFPVY